jgi:triosephosphate isomerase
MHLTPREGAAWVGALAADLGATGIPGAVEAWAFPAFPALPAVIAAAAAALPALRIGAQNVHAQPQGAFTGDVSAAMLTAIDAHGVLVGHSERRAGGETDDDVRAKLAAAEAAGLSAIVCVGEALPTREIGAAEAWVSIQIRAAFAGRPAVDPARVAVAYEPIWAIGTGRTATPTDAATMHAAIRRTLAEVGQPADQLRILYGGSVKPDNARDLIQAGDVDGLLVGGASLDPVSFANILRAAAA